MDAYGIEWELEEDDSDVVALPPPPWVKLWVKPLAREIRMDAEIGSYQPDDAYDERDREPVQP